MCVVWMQSRYGTSAIMALSCVLQHQVCLQFITPCLWPHMDSKESTADTLQNLIGSIRLSRYFSSTVLGILHSKKCWVKYSPALGKIWTNPVIALFSTNSWVKCLTQASGQWPNHWIKNQSLGLSILYPAFFRVYGFGHSIRSTSTVLDPAHASVYDVVNLMNN